MLEGEICDHIMVIRVPSRKSRREGGGCLETRVWYEMLSGELRDASVRLVRGEEWKNSLRESHVGSISEEVVREFEESVEGIRRIVPGVLCGRYGFEDVRKSEVEKIVENEERLKRGFVKVGELFDSNRRSSSITSESARA